jgi:UDP-N-acetylmuramate: L-alanyl-gamma-D-glutamyl-meso-diaminopimelate ligase
MAKTHFIGICGTAMATLAAMLKKRGHAVQGSDLGVYPPMSEFLAREGIAVFEGYQPERITPDIDRVIVGNAISRGNPELEEVLDRKIRFASLPEAVRDEFLWQSRSVVIAGTHGKTTTTALAGWLLAAAGRDPSILIGGIAVNFDGSYRLGSGRDFVIEGDEMTGIFDKMAVPQTLTLWWSPIAEHDHADRGANRVPAARQTLCQGRLFWAPTMRKPCGWRRWRAVRWSRSARARTPTGAPRASRRRATAFASI